jgi:hypothetical protein
MKRIMVITICFFMVALQASAQHRPYQPNTYTDDDGTSGDGFKKQNLFLGGSLNLGYDGYDFNVGGAPEIGYSLNRWVDVGLLVNLNYNSERADPDYNYNIRQRSFTYGTGAFGRVYPFPIRVPIFFQVEPEYNWTHLSAKDMNSGLSSSLNLGASSLLLGVGYGQRIRGRSNFYLAVMFDALSNYGSPYREFYNNSANTIVPVIKAGFDIYLHPSR